MYYRRNFINNSVGNANIECVCNDKLEGYKTLFISISDCKNTVFLHPIKNENGELILDDFIDKLSNITVEIYDFIKWLNENRDVVKEMEVFKR